MAQRALATSLRAPAIPGRSSKAAYVVPCSTGLDMPASFPTSKLARAPLASSLPGRSRARAVSVSAFTEAMAPSGFALEKVPNSRYPDNQVTLKGTLTAAPDTASLVGTQLTTFCMAFDCDKSPRKEALENIVHVEVQGDLAHAVANELKESDRVVVIGQLHIDSVNAPNASGTVAAAQVLATQVLKIVRDENVMTAPSFGHSVSAPAVLPKDTEGKWALFMENPKAFYDNRDNKRNPRAPDFKHKAADVAMWLSDRNLPSWVPQFLADWDTKNGRPSLAVNPRPGQHQQAATLEAGGSSPAVSAPAGSREAMWIDVRDNYRNWYDNRATKLNPKAPDFKRKDTGEGLWISSKDTPEWVPEWAATIPPPPPRS